MVAINITVEGYTDAVVVRVLCENIGLTIKTMHNEGGAGNFDKKISGYNNAAKYSPWLALRDLDDAECPPILCEKLLPKPAKHIIFRIAVREIEAWLLADKVAFAKFIGVNKNKIPENPESIDDPKGFVIELAKRSRFKSIKEDIIPTTKGMRKVGPAYASRIAEFALSYWDPVVAAKNSSSLRKCISRLNELKSTFE
ncbi:hypothetical protein J7L05_04345 [bacterium]|nr:hypothetical protein [bacterium]